MEKIHQRKSETDTGPHRPQELSHLHDNEGTKRTTSTLDARTKSIQLQNRIPTRKGTRKARSPHKKRGRPTHSRTQETHSKRVDPTAKGTILGYPETDEVTLDVLEKTEFQDKDEGEIQKASNVDNEIQDIKRNWDEGSKEMKGIALGLCQGKDGLLWYQGKIGYQRTKGYEPLLSLNITNPDRRDMAERQNLPNS